MAKKKEIPPPAKIFTIGFTRKSAETFFELLELHQITEVIDVRLYANTQFAGFAKAPDLKFFLKRVSSIEYRRDLKFAPTEELFKSYQKQIITWADYEKIFAQIMKERHIESHIQRNYSDSPEFRYCLLCTEVSAENCHRRLVAEKFAEVFDGMEIIHL
ncbi:MAG: DUF488 domain-containing protein [Selenomonadaceae bacterium]|nr:DUF488 domain-containing protein [Selenomonadaceae bacterium]